MRVVRGRKFSDTLESHPCFSEDAHGRYDVLHLPVAPECNIECKYCEPGHDCINDSAPGRSSSVIGKVEAIDMVKSEVGRNPRLKVVAISGPGEPLANPGTIDVMRAVHRHFPFLTLCVSTNGLLLPDRVEDLVRAGVRSLSITMNAAIPEVGENIYSTAYYRGSRYTGRAAADIISYSQWRGLRNAIDAGIIVKVNSMVIPGVNVNEIPYIAWLAGRRGADVQNIIPFTPQGDLAHMPAPSAELIGMIREKSAVHIKQITHCAHGTAATCVSREREETATLLAQMTA